MMTIENSFNHVKAELTHDEERLLEISLWNKLFDESLMIIDWDEVSPELKEQYDFGELNPYDVALQMYSDHETKKYDVELRLNPVYKIIVRLFGVESTEY